MNQRRNFVQRLLTIAISLGMVQSLVAPLGQEHAFADSAGSGGGTAYQVEITEAVTDGYIHPGVGLTRSTLETMRSAVQAQQEPWYSYYRAMTASAAASKTVTSSNQSSSDASKPASVAFNSQGFNSRFIADGLKAYTQSLMYYITGDETYRANAMHIIRIWSQMDPAQYVYFTDSHIHTGIPLNRMVAAAEILRYSSYQTAELAWTEKDTADFTNHLITPVIETFQHDNNYFMNQHNYPLLGAMAGYIFTNNRERYNEAVEWFTVNKTVKNQGFNGSVQQLFRLVDTNAATGEKLEKPVVQHVEMGRDQAHGGGDLTNSTIISRMLLAQGTKVDPTAGTVSTAGNAVGPYEFLNDRILAAADYFWQYMLGYDTPWVPVVFSTGQNGEAKGIYHSLSDSYRGRMTTANFWDLYYYYTYNKGIDVKEKAPYYYEAFTKRIPTQFYHQGALQNNWDNVDGGGDFWLYLPAAAANEGSANLPKEQPSAALVEIEDRYTAFDNRTITMQEGNVAYVEVKADPQGSQFVVQNLSYADRSKPRLIGLKFRTNGSAVLQLSKEKSSIPYHTLTLPDTGGEWRYITYDMSLNNVSYGQLDSDYNLLYLKAIGNGTTVDLDHFNVQAGTQLTPPVFTSGTRNIDTVGLGGSAVTLDFSATDSGSGDTLRYESANLPQGAMLDAMTGAFTWTHPTVGNYSFVVSASDGTTLATKRATLTIAGSREAAVQAASLGYVAGTVYTSASLQDYMSAATETEGLLQTADSTAFAAQLIKLKQAADGLAPLTLRLSDGSMDYPQLVSSSTFGSSISMLTDGNNNTFPVYTLAPYPDLYHILDFGPGYKISATAFSLQSRMNFVDRMAGSAVFGSNDKLSWTRLTPEETPFTDDLARLEVDSSHRNERYRFIKIQMLHPQPDVLRNLVGNILELGEFRIFGERLETVNKLQTVSIGSDQAVEKQITNGDTIKLTFKSTEPIQSVKAVIQGQEAAVQSDDQLNWTATAAANRGMPGGAVQFRIEYTAADGTAGDPVYFTTDNSLLYLLDRQQFIDVGKLAKATASDAPFGNVTKEEAGQSIFDGDTSTFGDLQTSTGSYYTVDFGAGSSVRLNQIMLMPRASQPGRMNGMVVQGSNDNVTWTDLTAKTSGSVAQTWTYIGGSQILIREAYRYIRLFNASSWFGNIAEVKFYGEFTTEDLKSKMSLPAGYTQGSYYLYSKEVKRIESVMAKPDSDRMALLQEFFAASSLLVPRSQLSGEKLDIISTMVVASTKLDKKTPAENGWSAFDGNLATFTDSSLNPSWIQIDFGQDRAQAFSLIKFYPRNDKTGTDRDNMIKRANGAILQGSSDGVNYTNLYTISGVDSAKWYTADLGTTEDYRYLRYYTTSGFANVAELEIYGPLIDGTLLDILLDEAAALKTADYTEDSYGAVEAAALAALPVAQNTASTQAQIDESANTLRAALEGLKKPRIIVELNPVTVTTVARTAPILPSVVHAVYSDQTSQDMQVKWDEIAPVLYELPGSFTVSGAVYGTELRASAFVQVSQVDEPVDTEPPSAPEGLTASAVTDGSLLLSWKPASDNVGVARYELLQDNRLAATLSSTTYSYGIAGLAADTMYSFQIVAYDAAGNHASSDEHTFKTLASDPDGGTPGNPDGDTPGNPDIGTGTATAGGAFDAAAVTQTVTGSRIEAEALENGGSAEVVLGMEILVKAFSGAAADRRVTLRISGAETASNLSLKLPMEAWQQAKQKGISEIVIESGLAGITLPVGVIDEMSSGGTLALTISKVNTASLSAGLADRLKDMPVLEFGLSVNGKAVTTFFKNQSVELRIPYEAKPGQPLTALVGVYINEQGNAEVLRNSNYEAELGLLTLRTEHFSKYAVMLNQVAFSDVGDDFWAGESITALASRQLLAGDGAGRFAPGREITRGEYLKLMMDAYGLAETGHPLAFTDAKPGQWYSDAVATASSLGIVHGYSDGSFGLAQPITRQELAVIAVRVLKAAGIQAPDVQTAVFTDAEQIADYAKAAVHTLGGAGWMKGRSGGAFAPEASATRAEAVAMLARMMKLV
ncbi:S-layer homology domain-containing protein [Paenibacillus tritici]|uniref:S-layer homology domain-containing protein n=1 Tax=Paenibacillus tritici TaxID=1873425 RepID=UPI001BACDD5F|nr:S-layer homology domain-containing protein [Paenibacillus tritici]QUL53415.1 S-layer homology domain-containing protein [Paenibacillus tritici]